LAIPVHAQRAGSSYGLGPVHTVNLAEARVRARQARQLILDGKDPIEVKYEARHASRSAESMLFRNAARQFIELYESEWKNARHRQQWRDTLRDYASTLGGRPISAIDGALITDTLAPIWTTKAETARRVKQRIERVCQWVRNGMPLPNGKIKRNHHEAMPFAERPAFMKRLGNLDGVKVRALEFTILTAARTSETLKATWGEIAGNVWTIPAARMKGDREHRVPLSAEAVQILDSLPRDGSGLLFPSSRAGRPLSPDSMQKLLARLRPGLTVHGFRSSFRDWAGDRTAYPRDVVEMALAHAIKDKTEAAYRRGDALEKRRRLMVEWARYCYSPIPTTEGVVSLRA
jgi:integrase